MGACDFQDRVRGKTAQEAFDAAVTNARYLYGHGGYTGTIAEKHEFRLMKLPDGMTVDQFVIKLSDDYEEDDDGFNPYYDKWGPAGCVDHGDGTFSFFGIASS